MNALREKPATRTRRFPFVFALTLVVFCTSLAAWAEFPALRYVGYGAFIIMVGVALTSAGFRPSSLPPELGTMAAWLVWSVSSGVIVMVSGFHFWFAVEQYCQVLAVTAVGAVAANSYRTPGAQMLAAIATALLVGGYGILGGPPPSMESQTERIESVLGNPNSLGILCLWGLAGCLHFWSGSGWRVWWRRPLLVAAAGALLITIILTASRKSLLGVILLVAGWAWFCYRRVVMRNLWVTICLLGLCGGLYVFTEFVLESTLAGKRFERVTAEDEKRGGLTIRLMMYEDGLAMFWSSPLQGVGLNQSRFYSRSGSYTHSDLMEVFSGTGLVGGALYLITLGLLWRRLWRVHKSPDFRDSRSAGLGLAVLVVYLVVGLGAPMYHSTLTWSLMAGFIGLSPRAERELAQVRRRPLRPGIPRGLSGSRAGMEGRVTAGWGGRFR